MLAMIEKVCVETCFMVSGAMPPKKRRQKQLEQSIEKARKAKETELLVRGHPVALILKCKVNVVMLNAGKAISLDFC